MSRLFWGFFYALAFLSRVPVPRLKRTDNPVAHSSLWFYPVVGALLGALLYGLAYLAQEARPDSSALLMAALLLLVWVFLTGAMHLDGLADCADAWVGGLGDKERTLAIMKDPQSGPMGVTALVVILLLKFAALAALLQHQQPALLLGLLLIPILARTGILTLMASLPYLRSQGLASALHPAATAKKALILTMLAVALTLWLAPERALVLIALWFVLLWLWRRALHQRLGGYTGDTLGAAIELQEALLLLVLVF